MAKIVNNFGFKKALFVMDGSDNVNVIRSARNIPNIKTAGVNTINPHDILKYDTFVATKDAIAKIQEVYV
jgi:large subunit ribosomal protein L4